MPKIYINDHLSNASMLIHTTEYSTDTKKFGKSKATWRYLKFYRRF